ncbi:MAG: ParA family protein [Leptolyngbya sp. SIO4C5]|uniref:ParA family protein n=1 Tax=Sphaerothrix gracilis TaxID=3151835 RepID=UPI0013C163C8|nr:ParA family protein [Leptolyngbya sp. SIO4C5]
MNRNQLKIAVMSNAGGTGKTTLTVNLANELSLVGHSVCAFGLDPNASLGMFLGLSQPDSESLGNILLNEDFSGEWPLHDCWPSRSTKVQACLGGRDLDASIEKLLVADRKTEVLRDRLEDYPLPHDFLIFDCPGTVDLMHKIALSACDFVLISVCPDAKGFYAVATLLDWFYTNIRRLRLRPAPEILGVVPNRVQAIEQHQAVLGLKRKDEIPPLPDLLAASNIHLFEPIKEYAEISKSVMEGGLPLRAYRPGHPANKPFHNIATVLIEKRDA